MKIELLKKIIKQICDYLFEIFMWVMIMWLVEISIILSCTLYKYGIAILVFAIILTFAPEIFNKLKTEEE